MSRWPVQSLDVTPERGTSTQLVSTRVIALAQRVSEELKEAYCAGDGREKDLMISDCRQLQKELVAVLWGYIEV